MNSMLQFVTASNLSDAAMDDIYKVLQLKDKPLELLLSDLMVFAGLEAEILEKRLRSIIFQQCMIHLADDLADGDCTYLTESSARGPTALCSIQNLVSLSLLEANLSPCGIRNFYSQMMKVGSAQHEEIRTAQWTLDRSKAAACGLNGALHAAYFALIWEGTQWQAAASDLGHHYGIACHVATDAKSRDPRYMQLAAKDRSALKAWALTSANRVYEYGIPRLQVQLLPVYRYLR